MCTVHYCVKYGTVWLSDVLVVLLTLYRKLQHKNLVKLYGVCTKKKPIMIVTEYMKFGLIFDSILLLNAVWSDV